MFRRIVVPLDGSELAEQALVFAEQMASEQGSELVLLRVVNGVDQTTQAAFVQAKSPGAAELALEHERRAAAGYLAGLVQELLDSGITADWTVRTGDPAGEIVEYCVSERIELVVMSTHGRSGLGRWVYGSVADRVLRGGTVPVLLIRAGFAEKPSARPAASFPKAVLPIATPANTSTSTN